MGVQSSWNVKMIMGAHHGVWDALFYLLNSHIMPLACVYILLCSLSKKAKGNGRIFQDGGVEAN